MRDQDIHGHVHAALNDAINLSLLVPVEADSQLRPDGFSGDADWPTVNESAIR